MNNRYSLKNEVLLLMLLTVAGLAKAQSHEFAPVGAEWYYGRLYRVGWNYTGVAYDRFRSIREVEINGLECKEIELYQHLDEYGTEHPHVEWFYINQEQDKVYEVYDGQRFLLYDFGKESGESWYAPKYNVTVYVDSVFTMTLEDGSIRKLMSTHSTNEYLYYNNIIEGVGLDMSLFPFDNPFGPPQSVHDYIRCYSENGIPLIVSEEVECDYEILAIDENNEMPTASINTLVDDMLHIDFLEMPENTKQIKIIDLTGRIVCTHETMDKALDISFADKPRGVYLIQIITGSQVINNKMVKR